MYRIWLAIVCSLLIVLVVISPSSASFNSDGYVAQDGLYFNSSGVAHSRDITWYKDWIWVNSCYVGGCYQAGYWTYTWKYYYKYTPVVINASEKNAEDQLVALAVARAKTQDKMALEQQRHLNLMEMANQLGLQGNFKYNGQYGGFSSYPQGNLQLSSAGVNGNTVYGYTYASAAQAYGETDLNALYQQAARLTQNAQQLAGQGHTDFSDLVKQAGGNSARIAEILAKANAGRQIIDGIKGTPEVKVESRVTQVGGGSVSIPEGNTNVVAPRGATTDFTKLSGPGKCMACHSGNRVEGKFDVTKVPQMSAEEIVKVVIPQLVSRNGKAPSMPKDGQPLTAQEVRQFLGGQ